MKKLFELKGAKFFILTALLFVAVCFAISSEVTARFQVYGLLSYLVIIGIAVVVTAIYELIFYLFRILLNIKDIPFGNIARVISIFLNVYIFIVFKISNLFDQFSLIALIFISVGLVLATVYGYFALRVFYNKKDTAFMINYFVDTFVLIFAVVLTWGLL